MPMRASVLLILACVALAASACGPSGQAPGGGAAPGNVTVATPPPAAAATPAGAATPATGATTKPAATAAAKPTTQPAAQPSGPQEISVNALQGEPDNLDPNRSSFSTEGAVIRQVFEPLLTFDKDLKPVPAAASGYDVSQDGKTYTFHLKQGAKWSDGQPVTAKDFVYSYKRILDPNIAAEYASFFADAGIVGAADYNGGKGSADNVGIKAVDDNTLEIQVERPVGYFPNLVALWVVPPLREDIIQKAGDAWAQDPSTYIGNGPFKMSEWVHQDHITLVPNPNYGGTAPKLQKVTFLMVTNGEADYAAYRNNERDWTLVPDADVQAVRGDSELSKQSVEYTELTTFWLIMNNAKKPLDNPSVRKALSKAIDRSAMIRDVGAGVGKPATSMIPPGMPGYQADLGKDIDFDANGAKQLLSDAGFSDPSQFPQMHFRFATTSANQARAEFIQAQLKQNLGINIVLDSMEAKAYQAAFKDKDFDLAFGGWGADYPDPQDWMASLFGCKASNNKFNYCNQQFDQASAKGDTGTDLNQRLQAYAEAQKILVQDLPVAPLFYRGRMVLVKPWVQNMVITPKGATPSPSGRGLGLPRGAQRSAG
ncbi:MAG: peptide ABC transporter substrate-binding protein [Chloroflexi bacterium]|nr:MAG: peptide ABC transporter substrate-binding protein [Chloroflexota bacterium]